MLIKYLNYGLHTQWRPIGWLKMGENGNVGLLSLELCSRSGSHRGPHPLLSSVLASPIASAECQDHLVWGAQCFNMSSGLESKCSSTQDSVALAQQFLTLPCGDGGGVPSPQGVDLELVPEPGGTVSLSGSDSC